jgi:hypothetical protein
VIEQALDQLFAVLRTSQAQQIIEGLKPLAGLHRIAVTNSSAIAGSPSRQCISPIGSHALYTAFGTEDLTMSFKPF